LQSQEHARQVTIATRELKYPPPHMLQVLGKPSENVQRINGAVPLLVRALPAYQVQMEFPKA
jgi:hypothetical protein